MTQCDANAYQSARLPTMAGWNPTEATVISPLKDVLVQYLQTWLLFPIDARMIGSLKGVGSVVGGVGYGVKVEGGELWHEAGTT